MSMILWLSIAWIVVRMYRANAGNAGAWVVPTSVRWLLLIYVAIPMGVLISILCIAIYDRLY